MSVWLGSSGAPASKAETSSGASISERPAHAEGELPPQAELGLRRRGEQTWLGREFLSWLPEAEDDRLTERLDLAEQLSGMIDEQPGVTLDRARRARSS